MIANAVDVDRDDRVSRIDGLDRDHEGFVIWRYSASNGPFRLFLDDLEDRARDGDGRVLLFLQRMSFSSRARVRTPRPTSIASTMSDVGARSSRAMTQGRVVRDSSHERARQRLCPVRAWRSDTPICIGRLRSRRTVSSSVLVRWRASGRRSLIHERRNSCGKPIVAFGKRHGVLHVSRLSKRSRRSRIDANVGRRRSEARRRPR